MLVPWLRSTPAVATSGQLRRTGDQRVSVADRVPAGIDTRVATAARMYDYWLGGHDNFAADRIAALKVAERSPEAPMVARANRAFLGRAARFLVGEAGIRQFLDLGTGLPSKGNVHQVAQAVAQDARIVYVDNDPMVPAHSRALKTGDGTAVIRADLRDAAAILEHPDTRRLIDFSQPLAILFVAVLHFVGDPGAQQAVAAFTSVAVPGSYVVLSHITGDPDPEAAAQFTAVYGGTANPNTLRSRQEILGLFGGLEMVEPGLVPVQQWRPDDPHAAAPDKAVYVDNDPMVLAHARALKTGEDAVVIHADLREVGTIIDHPDTRRLIDFTQPLAVLFVAVLHFVGDPDAHEAVARFAGRTAPGSYLVLSHVTQDEVDPQTVATGTAVYASTANPIIARPRAKILEFFDGLDIVQPGLVPVAQWRPDEHEPVAVGQGLLGGVGKKLA